MELPLKPLYAVDASERESREQRRSREVAPLEAGTSEYTDERFEQALRLNKGYWYRVINPLPELSPEEMRAAEARQKKGWGGWPRWRFGKADEESKLTKSAP